MHAETGGLFDPTVQLLFRLYAEAGAAPVSEAGLQEALARVGMDRVRFDADAVGFARPGMALTLNGIAQGHVTDRIADLLRARGLRDMLVDIGEIAAVGRGPAGGGWRVALAGENRTVELCDRAIATSAPLGTVLDPAGRIGHILHPRHGWVAPLHRQASVIATTAARADALSTAAVLMTPGRIAALSRDGVEIITA